MRKIIIILILLIFAKVVIFRPSTEIYKTKPMEQYTAKRNIIFIPGYYGTSLREVRTKRRYFVTLSEVFFGAFTLSLHRELLTPPSRDLEPEGVIGAITVVPALYRINIYASLLDELQETFPNSQIIPFVYDWRTDLAENSDRLAAMVDALAEKKVPSISIVAHSMGGLIATNYLGYGDSKLNKDHQITWEGAKNIQKVVFLGVPFGGAMSIFRNMQHGANFDWNKEMLQADAVASFPASYYLMPRFQTKLFFTDKTSFSTNLFDPTLWINNGLGLLRRQELSQEVKNARVRFTTEQLEKSLKFSDRVQFGGNQAFAIPKNTQVLNVIGKDTPTLDGAYFDKKTGQFLFFKKDVESRLLSFELLQSDGDGTVTTASAELPPAMQPSASILQTSYGHDKLFKDPKILEAIKGFLR